MCPAKHQAFCPIHQTFVNLKQGFESCMVEHQCFSDDPCPLSEKFEAEAKISMTARIKPKNRPSQGDASHKLSAPR